MRAKLALGALALAALWAQPAGVVRDGTRFRRDLSGSAVAPRRLHIVAQGPVKLEPGSGKTLTYTVRLAIHARSEAEARHVLERYAIRAEISGDRLTLSAPAGPVSTAFTVRAPRLEAASIVTTDGAVEAYGVNGLTEVETGAGEIAVDRIQGECRLRTGGGDIRAGTVAGALYCRSDAGRIEVGKTGGMAVLETVGGDIVAQEIGGAVRAETGAGRIHIVQAGGSVAATNGGGEILVERATGVVTARNMAGPVQVRAARGVECESASGGIQLGNINGAMRVSTSLGNILANLMGARPADSFLATGNGDITVLIPSNVGVTIRARNAMADSLRRITCDFSAVTVRRMGRQVIAEGPVNGGGPVLQISATAGNIFIRKQP